MKKTSLHTHLFFLAIALVFSFFLLTGRRTSAETGHAQTRALQPSLANPDFEVGTVGQVPDGWFSPTTGAGFTVELVEDNSKSGKRAARISSVAERPANAAETPTVVARNMNSRRLMEPWRRSTMASSRRRLRSAKLRMRLLIVELSSLQRTELQRAQRPLDTIARFLGGVGPGRTVEIVDTGRIERSPHLGPQQRRRPQREADVPASVVLRADPGVVAVRLDRGSIVVADNILIPGAPKYRDYMRQQQGKLFDTVERQHRHRRRSLRR